MATVVALESAFVASLAAAQASEPSAHTVAVDMFDAGDALMKSGRVHEACPKYAESYRLDPRLGALLHWADCLEQDGKLASAYAAFRDAVELAERSADRRSEFAAARVRSLEPRLSRIVIDAPQEGLPEGVTIQLDSLSIVASGLGVGIAVDPGEHSVRASAPGFAPFASSLVVSGAGQVQRVAIPALERLAPAVPESSAAAPVVSPESRSSMLPDAQPHPESKSGQKRSSNSQKWLGVGVGGAGVVALGASAVFFGTMASALNQRDDLCPSDPCPTNVDQDRVRSLESQARTAETWGLVLSISGAVAVVTGTVLYLRSGSDRATLRTWQPRFARSGVAQGFEWRF
ncbi:MAG TPA: carboxypeptidase-like regulatory domain-containing protein [Polyangiaceae bacterium]|nr:carboxypeptidase-like regulatory domain-containing protein [Polyangiaceae bacterium]